MAVKSIIEIDVQDDAFRKFKELYDRYTAELSNAPGQWKNVDAAVAGIQKRMADLVNLQQHHVEISKTIVAAQVQGSHAADGTAKLWQRIEHSGRLFARHISEITLNFLKWGPLLAATLGGLSAAGGLFGFDRLAKTASAGLRTSLGVGGTYGGVTAFTNAFGPTVGDPMGVLSNIERLRADKTNPTLARIGMTAAQLAPNRPTEQVGLDVMQKARQFALTTDPSLLAPYMKAYGWDQIYSLQQMKALGGMSPEMWKYTRAQATQQTPVSQATLEGYAKFVIAMDQAGAKITNTLMPALSGLTGPLTKLTGSFSNAVAAFLTSDLVKSGISSLSGALDGLAAYMAKPAFKQDFDTFMTNIGKAAADLDAFAKRLEKLIPDKQTVNQAGRDAKEGAAGGIIGFLTGLFVGHPILGAEAGAAAGGGYFHELNKLFDYLKHDKTLQSLLNLGGGASLPSDPNGYATDQHLLRNLLDRWLGYGTPATPVQPQAYLVPGAPANPLITEAAYRATVPSFPPPGGAPSASPQLAALETRYGLPGGLLGAVRQTESGGDPYAVSPRGAMGAFQFMPGTAARYGVNPWDPASAAGGAARMLSDLMHDFGGSVAKALASYNWGEANVKRDIAQYGPNWAQHLPNETANYLENIYRLLAGQGERGPAPPATHHTIRIENNTGSNAVVTAGALSV